jgi:Flp pilus assembly pilin Flp
MPAQSRSKHGDEAGQAFAEYALVLAGIAIICIVAILFVSGAVGGLFDSTGKPGTPGTFKPPSAQLSWPTTIEECEDGGWRNFAQFSSEKECKEYVEGLAP